METTKQKNKESLHPLARKLLMLLSILSLSVLLPSCSQKAYSGAYRTKGTTKTHEHKMPESKAFKAFMAKGAEKKIATNGLTPGEVIKTARTYLGVPHCMGGHSKKCTDCSGFVMAVFAEYGIKLPHSSEEQARYGTIIPDKSKLKKGDLVFFINSYKTSKYITHAGIYLGNNQFIHTSSKKGVSVTSLDNSWWKDKFIFGTRILK